MMTKATTSCNQGCDKYVKYQNNNYMAIYGMTNT